MEYAFNGIDYAVFVVMLLCSTSIGIYFGFFAKGADTTEEYLMGGKRMKTIPIAISLVASQLSAISMMTIPAEMYAFGINWYVTVLVNVITIPILCWIVIPVFYNNDISNCYAYLEMRFNSKTRKLITAAFVVVMTMMLPVFLFLPSMAFAVVTGINVHIINVVVSAICVFYTMFGGVKAVVWTDVMQGGIMLTSIVIVAILGVIKLGGADEVIRIAAEGHRLQFDFTFDATTRSTFWNIGIGSTVAWVAYVGFSQSCVQRIVALPSLKHAQRSIWLYGLGLFTILTFSMISGIVMYAYYHDCDPISSGHVATADRLIAYFVQDIAGHLNGMSGLFISAVFSAALSTLSACLNSLAGVVYFDYIKPFIRHTETRANFIMKMFVFVMGAYCVLGGVIVDKFSSIMQIVVSIGGLSFGAVFGVFSMGMLVPRAHGRAAFWSTVSSLVVMFIIVMGSRGRLHYKPLPLSTEGCDINVNGSVTILPSITIPPTISTNMTTISSITDDANDKNGFDIFQMSFNWYTVFGTLVVYVVGISLSYILPPGKDERCDRNLLAPFVQTLMRYDRAKTHEQHEIEELQEKNPQVF